MIDLIHLIFVALRISALAYMLQMLLYAFGWKRSAQLIDRRMNQFPLLSIVVAMRNESKRITTLLAALASQSYPANRIQVVLVDDGSEDASVEIALQAAKELGIENFKILCAGPVGKKAALQLGFGHALGEWILLTDADCVPHPRWAETMLSTALQRDILMVLGPVKIEPVLGWLEKFQACETNSLMAATAGSAGIGFPSMANGANVLIKRIIINEGSMDALKTAYASGDDMFRLEDVLRRFGGRAVHMAMQPEAIVLTRPMENIAAFVSQRLRWVSKSKGYKRPEIIVPALVVMSFNLLLSLLLLLSPFFPLMLLAYVLFLLLKTLVDIPLVWPAFRMAGQTGLIWHFLLFQLVYPLYVFLTVWATVFVRTTWKGRKISGGI